MSDFSDIRDGAPLIHASPGLHATTFAYQCMRRLRSNLFCMIRPIACLVVTFAIGTPVLAEPVAAPCPSGGVCASGEPPVTVQSRSKRSGYLAAIDHRSLQAPAVNAKHLDAGNASTTPQKAEPVLPLNHGWRSDFRAAPRDTQATVPARFTTDRPSGSVLSPSIKDAQLSVEAKQHAASWLDFLPERHTGWALVIGLLVVALRRVPIRFRSNGL
jgi:hypothetical protein